ncbi:hypothetical protein RhiirA4_471676 [Rhizophagus irregularis]|uniref:Uncharacterized protein n=1 Tax=Rhizophagus irregularis TaxID=588596 RepID=A0A2I1H3M2_9GLOM|nr:hypothetical protein RhiirA4_471676 [Rhizophagus irregularis]
METNSGNTFNEILLEEKPIVKIGEFDIKDPVNDIANGIVQIGTICLDFIPILWFEYLCHKFEKQDVLRIARKYVDEVRNNYIPPLPPHKSQEESIPSNTYCARHAECLFSSQTNTSANSSKTNTRNKQGRGGKRYHPFGVYQPRIFCAKTVPQKLFNDRFCNWYVEDERIVLEKDGWIAISQPENVREILVCPHPGKGYEGLPIPEGVRPINHKNNKELAVDLDFWTWIFETFVSSYLVGEICENTEHTPVELFALNFGSWEALETRNKQAKEFTAMYGKINNPKQYGIQNCMELESRYLISSEISALNTKVDRLENKLDLVVEKIDKVFSKLFPDEK